MGFSADNADMAKSRFKRVLNIMQEDGYITAKQHTDAKFPQTAAVAQQNEYAGPNGYLLDMVRRELVQSKAFTKEDLDTGGYKIITTIDKSKQDLMQSIGDTRLDDMPESLQIGGIALDPKTGEVLSVYAGSDYLSKQLNNADTRPVFEPGSTMKPFALLGAAQSGCQLRYIVQRQFPPALHRLGSRGEQRSGEQLGQHQSVSGHRQLGEHGVHERQ